MVFIHRTWKWKVMRYLSTMIVFAFLVHSISADEIPHGFTTPKINQKEKDDVNNIQLLLDNQKQLLQEIKKYIDGKILDLRHELEDLQKKNARKDAEDVKKLGNDIRLVRAIKSGWFSEAEEKLKNSDNDSYKYVIGEVYNNHTDNFYWLVRFGESIRDAECKFKVYDALFHEMGINGQSDGWKLLILRKSIKEILDQKTNVNGARTLHDNLWHEIKGFAPELIIAALQNDKLWPMAKQLSADIFFDCGQCTFDVYNKVIEIVWSNITISDLLHKTENRNFENIVEHIALHTAIVNKLNHSGTLNTSSLLPLTRSIHNVINESDYSNVTTVYRSAYDALYTSMKDAIRRVAVEPISTALLNDNARLKPIIQLCTDIHGNCSECISDICNEVIETVWNKSDIHLHIILFNAERFLLCIPGTIAVHRAVINKLKSTNTLNATTAKPLARSMKYILDTPLYKDVSWDLQSEYERLYETVKKVS